MTKDFETMAIEALEKGLPSTYISDKSIDCVREALEEVAKESESIRQENQRLKDGTAWESPVHCPCPACHHIREEVAVKFLRLRLARMELALKPFAKEYSDGMNPEIGGNPDIPRSAYRATWNDFAFAAKALEEDSHEHE